MDVDKKLIILEHLKEVMTLNNELDQYYEEHIKDILSFDLEISRFHFRHKMHTEHNKLPDVVRNSDLANRAKKYWDKEAIINKAIDERYGREFVYLLNNLYFVLDEVRNPGIAELINDGETVIEQLMECVYIDFCKRFVDPFEEQANVHFIEPACIDLMVQAKLYLGFM